MPILLLGALSARLLLLLTDDSSQHIIILIVSSFLINAHDIHESFGLLGLYRGQIIQRLADICNEKASLFNSIQLVIHIKLHLIIVEQLLIHRIVPCLKVFLEALVLWVHVAQVHAPLNHEILLIHDLIAHFTPGPHRAGSFTRARAEVV